MSQSLIQPHLINNGKVHIKGTGAYGVVCQDEKHLAVDCHTLDSLCESYQLQDIALMKMDIEGSELRTLQGSAGFFRRNPQVDVIFEANGAHCYANGYRPADLLRYFNNMGYTTYVLLPINQAINLRLFLDQICSN